MIFNTDEVIKVLRTVTYKPAQYLNDKEIQVIETLIAYLAFKEPKLTFEEFRELFKCEAMYFDEDTIDIAVTPRHLTRMHVDHTVNFPRVASNELGLSINPELEEHVYNAAYMDFINHVEKLGGKL